MFTPAELEKLFPVKKAFGYNSTQVDNFLEKVLDAYIEMYSQNAELSKKIELLLDKVNEYKDQEDSLQSAIMNAQKAGDAIIKEANAKAEELIKDAEKKADYVNYTASLNVDNKQKELEDIQKQVSDFKEEVISLYKQHIELLLKVPSVEEKTEEIKEEQPVDEIIPDEPVNEEPIKEDDFTKELPDLSSDKFTVNIDYSKGEEESEQEQNGLLKDEEGPPASSINLSSLQLDEDDDKPGYMSLFSKK